MGVRGPYHMGQARVDGQKAERKFFKVKETFALQAQYGQGVCDGLPEKDR